MAEIFRKKVQEKIFKTEQTEQFRKLVLSYKFNFYTLVKLPAAWFSGVRVAELNYDQCAVTVPFKWFSQNPFRSTYFACLAMAAEMSTGLLCMMAIHKEKPGFSMLVSDIRGNYVKKATNVTTFVCKDVQKIFETVERAKIGGDGETVKTEAVGRDRDGDLVARFEITWSIKQKSR
tara:strand:+ start:60 stop:587 length:528 start_codon:yes stop_codon:yes gene_type:complete